MSILDKKGWHRLDENHDEKISNGIRFVRQKESLTLRLDCSCCNKLISSIEDVETLKKSETCVSCYELYYVPNKEKWENGWRPNI